MTPEDKTLLSAQSLLAARRQGPGKVVDTSGSYEDFHERMTEHRHTLKEKRLMNENTNIMQQEFEYYYLKYFDVLDIAENPQTYATLFDKDEQGMYTNRHVQSYYKFYVAGYQTASFS